MDLAAHHHWRKTTGRNVINETLLDEWNPIGFNMPSNEYSAYAGTVGRLLSEGAGAAEIAASLGDARGHMGLDADPDLDRKIAERLAAVYPG